MEGVLNNMNSRTHLCCRSTSLQGLARLLLASSSWKTRYPNRKPALAARPFAMVSLMLSVFGRMLQLIFWMDFIVGLLQKVSLHALYQTYWARRTCTRADQPHWRVQLARTPGYNLLAYDNQKPSHARYHWIHKGQPPRAVCTAQASGVAISVLGHDLYQLLSL
jgi:hypothetical protein